MKVEWTEESERKDKTIDEKNIQLLEIEKQVEKLQVCTQLSVIIITFNFNAIIG